jgi:transcriptional regulator with XRE-family HTH domain
MSILMKRYPYGGSLGHNLSLYGYKLKMPKASRSYQALPAITVDQLQKLGRDIAVARKRRHLSMRDMAARMMVNLKTVQRLEKGDPTVGIGIVAGALWILGLDRRLGDLVAPESDTTGLQEDIKNLPRDFRKTRKRADKYDF